VTDRAERHLPSHVWNLVIWALAIAFLVVMMRALGWDRAREVVRQAGAWFPTVVALDLLGMACDAAAIHAFMSPEARMVSYWRVLAANASGRAVNLVTPGGALGEATKVTMLVGHAPRARVVSAIVLFDLAGFYLSVAIVLVGVPITLAIVDLPHDLEILVWVGLAMIAPIAIGLGVLVHRGALGTILDGARGVRVISRARADAWKAKLADIDRHLRELHADRSPGTRAGFAWMIASRLVSWIATGVVLHALGVELTPTLLVGVLSCGILIGWVANLVPFGLGIADGGNYALYRVLGAPGLSGVGAAMFSRARAAVLGVLGLVAMAIAHTINRVGIARRRRKLEELRRARALGESA
jgi:uncharacterized membrane protein YbhN (UPF0104 family)